MKLYSLTKINCDRIFSWISKGKRRILFISLLYPNIVCFTPDSTGTSDTFIDLMLGLGKYANVTYDCEGNVTGITEHSFIDYGASISHKIDIMKFGMRAGGYSLDNSEAEQNEYDYFPYNNEVSNSSQYINPFFGIDSKYFELNVGALFLTNYVRSKNINDYFFRDGLTQFTGLIRIGNRQDFYFSTQYLSNVPLLSGGGMFDMGFGLGNRHSRNLTWIGSSVGPFQNVGLALKQTVQLSDNIDLLIKGRIGIIESNWEGSIAAGVCYNF